MGQRSLVEEPLLVGTGRALEQQLDMVGKTPQQQREAVVLRPCAQTATVS